MLIDDILRKARDDADRDQDTELKELIYRTEHTFESFGFHSARAAVAQLEHAGSHTESSLRTRYAAEESAGRAKDRFMAAYDSLLARYADPTTCKCNND